MDNLTVKQRKILKGKLEGKTSKQIGAEVYPDTAIESAAAHVRATLRKHTLQEALNAELIKQGITLDKVLKPIALALNAKTKTEKKIGNTEVDNGDGTKSIEYVYETVEEDNIPLQLQGSDRASKLMGLTGSNDNEKGSRMSPEELQALAGASDEIELTRLLFKKS